MYTDFEYYKTTYGGKILKSDGDFNHFARKAERRLDVITAMKLQFAFPVKEKDVEAVKDCLCELSEFLYQVDTYQNAAMESVGVVAQSDGTVKGKVVSSITSGSESISYSAGGSASTSVMEAAKDKKVLDTIIYGMVQDGLSGVPDANGVNLLFAGAYPRKREVWNENKSNL